MKIASSIPILQLCAQPRFSYYDDAPLRQFLNNGRIAKLVMEISNSSVSTSFHIAYDDCDALYIDPVSLNNDLGDVLPNVVERVETHFRVADSKLHRHRCLTVAIRLRVNI